ncbi:ZP3 protein, partial [Polypterus senegalus]
MKGTLNHTLDIDEQNIPVEKLLLMLGALIVYTFTLDYNPSPIDGLPIVRTNPAVVQIECQYNRLHNVSSNALNPTWVPYTSTISAEDILGFSLVIMSSDWSGPSPSNTFFLGDLINLQASVDSTNHEPLRVFVDSCVATPASNASAPAYTFIGNNGWTCNMEDMGPVTQEPSKMAYKYEEADSEEVSNEEEEKSHTLHTGLHFTSNLEERRVDIKKEDCEWEYVHLPQDCASITEEDGDSEVTFDSRDMQETEMVSSVKREDFKLEDVCLDVTGLGLSLKVHHTLQCHSVLTKSECMESDVTRIEKELSSCPSGEVCWGNGLSAGDADRINRLIRKAGSILGGRLASPEDVLDKKSLGKLLINLDSDSHALWTVEHILKQTETEGYVRLFLTSAISESPKAHKSQTVAH